MASLLRVPALIFNEITALKFNFKTEFFVYFNNPTRSDIIYLENGWAPTVDIIGSRIRKTENLEILQHFMHSPVNRQEFVPREAAQPDSSFFAKITAWFKRGTNPKDYGRFPLYFDLLSDKVLVSIDKRWDWPKNQIPECPCAQIILNKNEETTFSKYINKQEIIEKLTLNS